MHDATAWTVIVPVKGAPHGKSRMGAHPDRPRLARALALDTITATIETVGPARVLVVTADPVVGRVVLALGARVLPDPGGGLDAAVGAGIAALAPVNGFVVADGSAGPRSPTPRTGLAVLLGDLPALDAPSLATALAAAAAYPLAVVPDRSGTGTVLLTTTGPRLIPAFGAGSAARHTSRGHVRLTLDLPQLRTDVDVVADLAAAAGLGVGRHTSAVLADVTWTGERLR